MKARPVLFVAALVAAIASPASAETPITAAFLAATGPFNGYLVASSRLAEAEGGGRLRGFARREAASRAAIVADLLAWQAARRARIAADAAAPTIDGLGPLFGRFENPIDIVVAPADRRQRADLEQLQHLSGAAFDALYVTSQRGTLRRLEAAYVDYIKNGDDEVLRALSVHDLHAVRALLAALPRG